MTKKIIYKSFRAIRSKWERTRRNQCNEKKGTQYFTMHLMEQLFWFAFHGFIPLRMCALCPMTSMRLCVMWILHYYWSFLGTFLLLFVCTLFYADRATFCARTPTKVGKYQAPIKHYSVESSRLREVNGFLFHLYSICGGSMHSSVALLLHAYNILWATNAVNLFLWFPFDILQRQWIGQDKIVETAFYGLHARSCLIWITKRDIFRW